MAAIALDHVVHGVGLSVLTLGDCSAPSGIIQAVLHGAAVGGAHKAQQSLLGTVILQAGLGGGGSGDSGSGEAAGWIKGLGQDELITVIADLGVISGNRNRIRKALAGAGRQGDLGSVDLIGLGIAGGSSTGGTSALIPFHSAGVAAAQAGKGGKRCTLRRISQGEVNTADGGFGDADGFGFDSVALEPIGAAGVLIKSESRIAGRFNFESSGEKNTCLIVYISSSGKCNSDCACLIRVVGTRCSSSADCFIVSFS